MGIYSEPIFMAISAGKAEGVGIWIILLAKNGMLYLFFFGEGVVSFIFLYVKNIEKGRWSAMTFIFLG